MRNEETKIGNNRNFRLGITIEDTFYSREEIKELSIEEAKMMMSQCENLKDCERIVNWKSEQDIFGILVSKLNYLYANCK